MTRSIDTLYNLDVTNTLQDKLFTPACIKLIYQMICVSSLSSAVKQWVGWGS